MKNSALSLIFIFLLPFYLSATQKPYYRFTDNIPTPYEGIDITSVAATPDGKTILINGQKGLFLYQKRHWHRVILDTTAPSHISSLSVSDNGMRMLIGTIHHGVFIFQNHKWQVISIPHISKTAIIRQALLSPDGRNISVVTDHNIYLNHHGHWHNLFTQFKVSKPITLDKVALSRTGDAALIKVCHDHSDVSFICQNASLYWYRKGQWDDLMKLKTFPINHLHQIAISENGKTLVVTEQNPKDFLESVAIYQNDKWLTNFHKELPKQLSVLSIAINQNGQQVFIGSNKGAYLFKHSHWKKMHFSKEKDIEINTVKLSPEGKTRYILANDGSEVYVYQKNKWQPALKTYGVTNIYMLTNINAAIMPGIGFNYVYTDGKFKYLVPKRALFNVPVAEASYLSEDGKTAILSLNDFNTQNVSGAVTNYIYKNNRWENLTKFGIQANAYINSVAMTPSANKILISLGPQGRVYFYSHNNWKDITKLIGLPKPSQDNSAYVKHVAISKNGRLMLISTDKALYMFKQDHWHKINLASIAKMTPEQVGQMMLWSFYQNGKIIIISTNEGITFIYQHGTWKRLRIGQRYIGMLNAIVSSSNMLLLSPTGDNKIYTYHSKQWHALDVPQSPEQVAISNNGKEIVAVSYGKVFIYNNKKWNDISNNKISSDATIIYLSIKNSGKIFLGTLSHGLYIYQTNHWQQIKIPPVFPKNNFLLTVAKVEQEGKIIFLGSNESGLLFYRNGYWQHWSTPVGDLIKSMSNWPTNGSTI